MALKKPDSEDKKFAILYKRIKTGVRIVSKKLHITIDTKRYDWTKNIVLFSKITRNMFLHFIIVMKKVSVTFGYQNELQFSTTIIRTIWI